jgi:hypothetical protein
MGVPFAYGIRMLLDSNQNFLRGGLPCYLRTKNEVEDGKPYVDLGFQVSASGSNTGFTDTQIMPQPEVTEVSLHNIGLNQARLQFGARNFKVSHTFVLNQMGLYGYTDPLQVWRNAIVIGLFYDNRLFSIESITHEDAGGDIIFWKLVANSTEQAVTVSGG